MNEKIPVKKPTDVVSQPTSTTSTAVEVTQTIFSGPNLNLAQNAVTISRAKSYNIHLHQETENYTQFVTTVKTYVDAGMPFEHIANAAEELGYKVERGETDAPIKEGWQDKVAEVIETEGRITSWQTRGETINLIPQLVAPTSVTGSELVTTSQNIVQTQTTSEQTLNVVEGINVQSSNYTEVQSSQTAIEQPASNVTSFSQFIRPLTDQELDEAA